MYYIGFDIGGSSVKSVLVNGRKIIQSRCDKRPKSFDGLVILVKKTIKDFKSKNQSNNIKGIGFSIAGILDKERKRVWISPNIKYLNGKAVKKIFQKALGIPVKIEHDVNCFLLAESKIGAAKNFKSVFYLTLGTGIGGALMIDRKIVLGHHGAAGEAGHMLIDVIKRRDFEKLASNKFFADSIGLNSLEAGNQARLGNKKAKVVFDKAGENIGVGVSNIINIFDPEAIILGGGISRAKPLILPGIKREIKKNVVSPQGKKTKILFSGLGRYGGAIGAALMFEKRNRI